MPISCDSKAKPWYLATVSSAQLAFVTNFDWRVLSLVLGCTIGCDQATKYLARTQLGGENSVTLPGGLGELRLAENPGSFLSLGASLPQSLRLAFFIAGVAVGLCLLLVWLVGSARRSWPSFLGLALVLAGGMSNLIDRVTQQGRVTDFIFIRIGPLHTGVFNLADSVIMTGIAVLACAILKKRHRPVMEEQVT